MRKLTAVGVGVVLTVLAVLAGIGTATAATTPAPPPTTPAASPTESAPAEGELVRARVRTDDGVDVEGVDIRVEQGGEEVATGTTDAEGVADIPVAEAGEYEIFLDLESLPAEVEGLTPQLNPIATTVNAGTPRTVAFRLSEGGGETVADVGGLDINWGLTPQLALSGLRFGLIIALASIGLTLIFGTTGLVNFAHGELITFGALTAYFVNVVMNVPLIPAAIITVIVCGIGGWVNDRALWGPLRKRGTGLIAMMIVSIGLSILLRYLFQYLFGAGFNSYADYQGQAGVLLGLRPYDLISMVIAVVVLVATAIALLRTQLGKATRAVADNPALASASGIDVDRVIRVVWISGAALAGLGGVLLGLAQQVNFLMGFQILLLVFAAVTLGGLGTAFGALLGSIVVGVFIEVSTLIIPTELKNVGALGILILILLVRPQGILGRAERVG